MKTSHFAALYWPIWLAATIVSFLVYEIYALATGHPENTLSDWVWRVLKIGKNASFANWTAADFLTFGVWMTLFIWLTFHFFFRRFT